MVIAIFTASIPVLAENISPLTLRAAIDARYPGVPWVTTEQLAGWMADSIGELVILDARQPAEYDVSHIRGARRVDPDAPDIAALHLDREARIVVYCSVGYRSASVARQLREAGYSRASNLAGGIFQWANEGRPVYLAGRQVQRVHPYDEHWGRMLLEGLRSPL
jgi:rhodanese-related sulfurtransferase